MRVLLRKFLVVVLSFLMVFNSFAPLLTVTATTLDSEAMSFINNLQNTSPKLPAAYGLINRDAFYTKDGLVNIEGFIQTASDSKSISQIRFITCNTSCDFVNGAWGLWQNFTGLNPLSVAKGQYFKTQMMLNDAQSSGVRQVCVQVKDIESRMSPKNSYSCDVISLDNLAPSGSILINGGAEQTDNLRAKLDITSVDPLLADGSKGSRSVQYTISSDKVAWQTWEPIGDHLDITVTYPFDIKTPTTVPAYVKFKDALGNESQVYSDTILFSPKNTSPSASNKITINEGAVFTTNQQVKLYFQPSKAVNKIKIWNRGENSDNVISQNYSSVMDWKLSNVYETKQVYAQFLYTDGKKSEAIMDEIIYAPEIGIEYSAGLPGYSEFTLGTIPSELGSGININMTLALKNIGTKTLYSNDAANKSNNLATHVSYHWYRINDDGSRDLYRYQGNRAVLNNNLNYLDSDTNVRLAIETPKDLGRYALQFDAVLESVSNTNIEGRSTLTDSNLENDWFSEFGYSGPEYIVNIIDGVEDNFISNNLRQSQNLGVASAVMFSSAANLVTAPFNYTVQAPRDRSWRCGGYDCYSGIAEEFYQCNARGIPNDAPDTTNESLLVNKCWYPIFNANRNIYNGITIPIFYRGKPWHYLEVGWILTIPADPWSNTGGGNPPPSIPGVPTLPAVPGSTIGIPGSTPQDPYAGINGANSQIATVTFDRFVAWDGSYKTDQIKWTETTRPVAPTITSITTNADGTIATVYGVGIPKNHPMKIGVWNEFRYCWGCGSGWEYFSQMGTAQHVKIALFKTDWTFLGYVWNDRADGRWNINLPLGVNLNPGDQIIAEVQVEADYWFSGLHWWSDTTESVNFNLRDRKYTGFPYFAGDTSNTGQIPAKPYLNIADWAIAYRTPRDSSSIAGDLHQYCGAWIRDYNYATSPGDNWQTYTNFIYNPNHNWAYRLRGDIRIAYWDKYGGPCASGSLGLPTSDDQWAANSPQGTNGAYQKFEKGTIHSSWKGTFATTGNLNGIHTNGGGTRTYGFPTAEQYNDTQRGQCQNFENGLLCEREPVDNRTPEERVIDLKANQLGSTGASALTNICGYPAKTYSNVLMNEDGVIVYVNGNAFYSYGGTLDTFNFYADKCTRFGIITSDPQNGGVGPFQTNGAYQDFQNGRIYWSWKYLGKFVFGTIRTKFEQAGGTNSSFGWPNSEVFPVSENGVNTKCQTFEGGRICEIDIPERTRAQVKLGEVLGREVLINEISTFCNGMEKVSIPSGIAYYDPRYDNVRRITGAIYTAWGENCDTYGLPENDTTAVSSYVPTSGFAQRFNKDQGNIQYTYDFYSSALATVVLEGAVRNLYNNVGLGLGTTGFPKRVYVDRDRGNCVETEKEILCERAAPEEPTCAEGEVIYGGVCVEQIVADCRSIGLEKYVNPNNPADITCAKVNDAPYINQWLNIGGVSGDPADGWMHCSAASSVMALGGFGKISESSYSKLKEFVYKDAVYTDAGIDLNTSQKSCPNLQGAFSYTAAEVSCNEGMWWRMAAFLNQFGVRNSVYNVRNGDEPLFYSNLKNSIDNGGFTIQGVGKGSISHIILLKGYTDDNKDGIADRVIVNDSFRNLVEPGTDYNMRGNGAIYKFNSDGIQFNSYYNLSL